MTYRPALRADLIRIVPEGSASDVPVALYDPVIGRRIDLGPMARSMFQVIDGQRTAEEVLAEVARAQPTRTRPEIEGTLRAMLLLLCLEGTGREVLERARAIRSGEAPLEPTCLEETRTQCHGSGACCQAFSFGPLTDEDVTRIESLDIAAQLPRVGPGPYVEELELTPGSPGRYLKTTEGRCIFLGEDRRCGLHARFGPESKPGLCRLFPLRALPTLRGNRVYDKGECSSFVPSSREGQLLRDELGRLAPLLPTTYLHHPIAFLDARTPGDYSYVLALSDALVGLAGRAENVGSALQAAADVTARWSAAIALSPLAPGAAEAASAQALARRSEAPAPVTADDFAALAQVTRSLVEAILPEAQTRLAQEPDRLGTFFASAFVESASMVAALAAHRASPAEAPIDAQVAALFAVDAEAPWVEDALRRSLRQRLFGGLLLQDARLPSGLASSALVLVLALTGARARALGHRRAQLLPDDLSFGHAMASRCLRDVKAAEVLIAHEGSAMRIVRAAGALLGGGA